MRHKVAAITALVFTILSAHGATFDSPYNPTAPTIDGILNTAEWAGASSNTITMVYNNPTVTHPATIYFKHDNTWLYIGVNSEFSNASDMYWVCELDGNNSHARDGNSTEPHVDISIAAAGPGRPSYYNRYDAYPASGAISVTPPTGTAKASAGSNPVTFEFKIKISELGATPGSLIGFYFQHGNNGSDGYGYTYVDVPIAQWSHIRLLNGSLNQGLDAYYAFNGNANDESGNGNNGTVIGATLSPDRFGAANSAYYFDGIAAQILAADPLPDMTSTTFSCWMKMQSLPETARCVFFEGDTTSGHDFALVLLSGDYSFFAFKDTTELSIPDSVFPLGTWFHLACAADSASETVFLWINGTKVRSIAHSVSANIGYHGRLSLGRMYDPRLGEVLHGTLDDVRFYNRALSDSEVLQLYTSGGGSTPQTAISNVRASQTTGTKLVEGYYDISGAFSTIPVAILISTNGGASYTLNGPTYSAVAPGNNRTFSGIWRRCSTTSSHHRCG